MAELHISSKTQGFRSFCLLGGENTFKGPDLVIRFSHHSAGLIPPRTTSSQLGAWSLMATSAIARISGRVLRSDLRDGVKDGRPWSFNNLTILVGGLGTTEIAIWDRDVKNIGGHLPDAGEDVDFLVEVVRSERGFNLNLLGNFDHQRNADALAAVA